ncbi:glycoside hydrolase superfamily [Schizothecium vesticola]|uniref:glucan 1,3-beta-glucosidase n=1 Tax=Schizothecium vesticola TaxID=314040 RepID=A0AA40K2B8_9PEZI|nr:glycoside hydrolase superfamily [Schizothecium vesticola]
MRKRSGGRVVSGAVLEEGRGGREKLRGGGGSYDSVQKEKEQLFVDDVVRKKKKKLWIMIGVGVVLVIILIIAVAVVVSKKNSGDDDEEGLSGGKPSGLGTISPDTIPPGSPPWLNPFVWADTTDFNVTYTNQMVGDLPVMGLFSEWDDSKAANDRVPALNKPWGDYSKRPARGVNIGGWLSLEPFITPSLFEYDRRMGIIDEGTLCAYLAHRCEGILEKHYATFVTEQTFKEIAAAGLDHVRIPFSYWAVEKYDGDPFLYRTSWRYLLRSIEWCRKYGLRVNLDLHGLPGSQNGWNHSGRQGPISWLNGTDGAVNAKRSLEVHDRLSKFFAQPRYENVISHYGLANEPKMIFLNVPDILDWTISAHKIVRGNGVKDAVVVFGDGFRGLTNWQGELQGLDNAALDVHQYVIFNNGLVTLNHTGKIRYACDAWTQQTLESMNRGTGFGPTLVAEWSQADTDCARHLTNVGWGNRWTGTYVSGDALTEAISPKCPLKDRRCDCAPANADPKEWSDSYKKFLRMFAEAQMVSFEKGWGWFYWVWDTESAPQWSYKKGLAAGILPAKPWERQFDCTGPIPEFPDLPESY